MFGSSAALHRIRASAGNPLDTDSPGQREFQALLMWCLLSPVRTLRWDTNSGRSFQDMHYYFGSVFTAAGLPLHTMDPGNPGRELSPAHSQV
jgi:hypothetical protein